MRGAGVGVAGAVCADGREVDVDEVTARSCWRTIDGVPRTVGGGAGGGCCTGGAS